MTFQIGKHGVAERISTHIKKGFQKENPAKSSAKMVKKEAIDGSLSQLYMVQKPYTGCQLTSLVQPIDPLVGLGGSEIVPDQVHGVFPDQDMALQVATELYEAYCDEQNMLEEKKGKVGDKIKKTIDHLEKKRKEHVDMAKEDPKNASKHKEQIVKIATQIDDLMSKMEKIEKSKKNIENKEDKKKKKDLKESSLNIGDNLKVGDKFVKKDKQVLTIKKIVGDQVYLESNKFEGKLWQWPKEIFDADVKSGELRWQPTQKESLEESILGTIALGATVGMGINWLRKKKEQIAKAEKRNEMSKLDAEAKKEEEARLAAREAAIQKAEATIKDPKNQAIIAKIKADKDIINLISQIDKQLDQEWKDWEMSGGNSSYGMGYPTPSWGKSNKDLVKKIEDKIKTFDGGEEILNLMSTTKSGLGGGLKNENRNKK